MPTLTRRFKNKSFKKIVLKVLYIKRITFYKTQSTKIIVFNQKALDIRPSFYFN